MGTTLEASRFSITHIINISIALFILKSTDWLQYYTAIYTIPIYLVYDILPDIFEFIIKKKLILHWQSTSSLLEGH